jgi:hypothetical protein
MERVEDLADSLAQLLPARARGGGIGRGHAVAIG